MSRLYDVTWGRAFSALYDRLFEAAEGAGLRESRRQALAPASGRTVEIGAGTGANLDLYPEAVEALVLSEPDPNMMRFLRPKAAAAARQVELVAAPAETLPYEDGSFDTVAFTLVLCTVPDPAAALREAARVLRPGGKLLFIEHVRSQDAALARWQDRLERPWHFIGDGCHCNRDTIATIEASPLRLEGFESERLPKLPPIVRPLVRGTAVLPAA
jgi:ubiquinone/menaquinone biosynthesis C-methylase UbiE